MTISDATMIFAILVGPIIAVRVTRFVDEQKEVRERKLWIYKSLIATRANTLSPQHVEALNRIDLEFKKDSLGERNVVEKWGEYLDLLGDKSIGPEQWAVRGTELLVELLHLMGKALRYTFDRTHIKNATYSPTGHEKIERQQEAIRQGLVHLLSSKRALPIFIANTSDTGGKSPALTTES